MDEKIKWFSLLLVCGDHQTYDLLRARCPYLERECELILLLSHYYCRHFQTEHRLDEILDEMRSCGNIIPIKIGCRPDEHKYVVFQLLHHLFPQCIIKENQYNFDFAVYLQGEEHSTFLAHIMTGERISCREFVELGRVCNKFGKKLLLVDTRGPTVLQAEYLNQQDKYV